MFGEAGFIFQLQHLTVGFIKRVLFSAIFDVDKLATHFCQKYMTEFPRFFSPWINAIFVMFLILTHELQSTLLSIPQGFPS